MSDRDDRRPLGLGLFDEDEPAKKRDDAADGNGDGLLSGLESHGNSSTDDDDYVDLSPGASVGPRHLAYLCFLIGMAALFETDHRWVGLVILGVGGALHVTDAALEADDLKSFLAPLLTSVRSHVWKVLGAALIVLGYWDQSTALKTAGVAALGASLACSLLLRPPRRR